MESGSSSKEEKKLYDGDIIDGHMHLWDLETKPFGTFYPWLKGPTQSKDHIAWNAEKFETIRKNYLLENYKQDTKNHHVVKSVHVQAECGDSQSETKWLQSLANEHGFPHGIIAHANLSDKNVDELLQFHSQFKNVRGIRQLLNWHEKENLRFCDRGDYLRDPAWWKGFALLEKYNFSFDLHIWHTQSDDAVNLATAFPHIQIILDHTGLPMGYLDSSSVAIDQWKHGLTKIAKCPNVTLKLSGLSMTHHVVTVENFKPLILAAIHIFGVERCFFSSNFPVDKINTTYDNLFNVFKECVKDFSVDDLKKLFHDNAQRVYRL